MGINFQPICFYRLLLYRPSIRGCKEKPDSIKRRITQMPLIIAAAIILSLILILRVSHDIGKNKRGNLIRQGENPSKCPECGYDKWVFVPDFCNYARRSVCKDCNAAMNAKRLKASQERQKDIQQNPFEPREIPLENGGYAIVENRDYDTIIKYRWYKNKDGYAVTKDCWGERVSMHRLVKGLGYVKGYHVHHKNHNPLDNRRKNLMRTNSEKHHRMHH
jgi:hypothetical protein